MAYERRGFKGGAKLTTLNGALSDSATTIPCSDLSTWTGVNTNGTATATISRSTPDEPLSDEEIITFTGISGNSLTGVTRGQGGTTAQAHSSGARIEHTSQVRDVDEANEVVAGLNTWTEWTPTYADNGSMTIAEVVHASNHRRYMRVGKLVIVSFSHVLTFGGTRQATFTVSLPVEAAYAQQSFAGNIENGVARASTGDQTTTLLVARFDGATLAAGSTHVSFNGAYPIA